MILANVVVNFNNLIDISCGFALVFGISAGTLTAGGPARSDTVPDGGLDQPAYLCYLSGKMIWRNKISVSTVFVPLLCSLILDSKVHASEQGDVGEMFKISDFRSELIAKIKSVAMLGESITQRSGYPVKEVCGDLQSIATAIEKL
jgi:hypothetical protein